LNFQRLELAVKMAIRIVQRNAMRGLGGFTKRENQQVIGKLGDSLLILEDPT